MLHVCRKTENMQQCVFVLYACLQIRGKNIYSSTHCKPHGNSTEQNQSSRRVSFHSQVQGTHKEKEIKRTGYFNILVGTSEYSVVGQTGLCHNTCPDLVYNAQLRNIWEQQHWFSLKPNNSNKTNTCKNPLDWQPARFRCRVK